MTGIPHRLEEQPELAEAFGFDPDDLPSDSTFRPTRLNHRLKDLKDTLTVSARKIREMGGERGAPVGYDLGSPVSNEEEENSNPSKRTIQRMLRKKGGEVLEELQSVALPAISLPRPDEPIYDK